MRTEKSLLPAVVAEIANAEGVVEPFTLSSGAVPITSILLAELLSG